jgi:hypothetical protein
MLEDVAMAISTGAAGNIVAYMLNGRVDALRDQVTKIFRHGTEQERSRALQALERDVVALSEHDATRAGLTNQWRDLLLSYLTAYPEAREEIEFFASSPVVIKTMNIGSQHNHRSGTFVGGDNYGIIDSRGRE